MVAGAAQEDGGKIKCRVEGQSRIQGGVKGGGLWCAPAAPVAASLPTRDPASPACARSPPCRMKQMVCTGSCSAACEVSKVRGRGWCRGNGVENIHMVLVALLHHGRWLRRFRSFRLFRRFRRFRLFRGGRGGLCCDLCCFECLTKRHILMRQ